MPAVILEADLVMYTDIRQLSANVCRVEAHEGAPILPSGGVVHRLKS